MSSLKLISSGQALDILRKITQRPKLSRCTLKYWVGHGRIQAFPIHSKRFRYDRAQIITLGLLLAEQDGLEPGSWEEITTTNQGGAQ